MSQKIANRPDNNEHAIDKEAILNIIAVQREELAFKLKELEAKKHEQDNYKELAIKSIDAQSKDAKESREDFIRLYKVRALLIMGLFILLAIFMIVALIKDKTDIVLEIIKYGGTAALGYFAGLGRSHFNQNKSNSHKSEDDKSPQ